MAIHIETIPHASFAREATETANNKRFHKSINIAVVAVKQAIEQGKMYARAKVEIAAVDFVVEKFKEQGYSVVYTIFRGEKEATLDIGWEV